VPVLWQIYSGKKSRIARKLNEDWVSFLKRQIFGDTSSMELNPFTFNSI
jgi:hypothetical protein